MRTKKILFFIMILHPTNGWFRVGKPHPSRSSANEWLPIARGYYRYCKGKVSQCTITIINGDPCKKSKKVLSEKFSLDS